MIIDSPVISGSLAASFRNVAITGSLGVTGSITTTGTITAQTLIVQTVTSSVIYSSGSNVFGNNISNTQVMTGSVIVTGSLAVVTNGTEFQVTSAGVNLGNALTDNHIISGSVRINPNGLFVSSSGNVGIGTTNPQEILHISSSSPAIRIGGARTYLLQTVDTDGRFRIHDNIAGERFTITSGSGFVGIGTTSPTAIMQIQGAQAGVSGKNLTISYNGTYYAEYTEKSVSAFNNPLTFGAGATGAEMMRISANGNVGIGVTNPSAKLEVGGTIFSTVRSATIDTDDGVSNNFQGYGGYWALRTDLTNNFNIDVYNNGTPKTSLTVLQLGGNVGIGTNNPPKLLTIYTAGTTIMRFQSGAATTDHWDAEANASARFYISNVSSGNGAYLVYNSSSGWTGVSDARWKTDWSNLEGSLSLINRLNIGKYKMLNNDKEVIENARWDYGIKAQELLDIIPDAVDVPNNPEDKHGVIHNIVFYHAIKAIQELKAQNDSLQSQIDELKNK